MSTVERVKGVQFNYVNFLWKEIAYARDLEKTGDYAHALRVLISLMPYLPRGIKDKFKDRARKIQETIQKIEADTQGPYAFNRSLNRNRQLQIYAYAVYHNFMDDLASELDKRGYMEKVSRPVDSNVSPEFFDRATR